MDTATTTQAMLIPFGFAPLAATAASAAAYSIAASGARANDASVKRHPWASQPPRARMRV